LTPSRTSTSAGLYSIYIVSENIYIYIYVFKLDTVKDLNFSRSLFNFHFFLGQKNNIHISELEKINMYIFIFEFDIFKDLNFSISLFNLHFCFSKKIMYINI